MVLWSRKREISKEGHSVSTWGSTSLGPSRELIEGVSPLSASGTEEGSFIHRLTSSTGQGLLMG